METIEVGTEEGTDIEAVYDLEQSVNCPHCETSLKRILAVRLLRTRVNFTSNLPRRGCVFVCTDCKSILPAAFGVRGL